MVCIPELGAIWRLIRSIGIGLLGILEPQLGSLDSATFNFHFLAYLISLIEPAYKVVSSDLN